MRRPFLIPYGNDGGTHALYTFYMRDILIILLMCVAAIAVGLFLFLHGPSSVTGTPDDIAPTVTVAVEETPVPFTVLDAGPYAANVTERKNVATRDEQAFVQLWGMVYNDTEGMPAIDFSKEYVIGVFTGHRTLSGHSIEITSITDRDGVRTVATTLIVPGKDCTEESPLAGPYELVAVPISTNEHRAVDTMVAMPCDYE